MDRLTVFMRLNPQHKLLDLACGKGRHSIYLNKKGFEVLGLDLSPQSITFAQQFANERLRFGIHDMRQPYQEEQFDVVLNLFTSFGFFDSDEEHLNTIKAVAHSLKPGGYFMIDFFNTRLVINDLVRENEVERGGVVFQQKRYVENNTIVKDIHFEDQGKAYHFQERVRALEEHDFRRFLQQSDLQVLHLFGNYNLDFYQPQTSERMIFIARKGG